MNKKVLILGTISTTLPMAAVVSCSTTWSKWEPIDAKATTTKIKSLYGPERLWKVRAQTELDKAYDSVTKTIDITKLNNQYELIQTIVNILHLKSTDRIDSYWNKTTNMKTFLNQLTKTIDFKIKENSTVTNIHWDATAAINKAVSGIDNWVTGGSLATGKAYDVEKNGLDSLGTPVDATQIAFVGGVLLGIPTVSSLLKYDSSFAMALSKLVNLPQETFEGFSTLMRVIDKMISDLWIPISHSQWFKGLDFTLGQTGKVDTYSVPTNTDKLKLIKGMFIIKALK